MPRVTDLIRDHLLESVGFGAHDVSARLPDLPQQLETEWCEEFEQARRYRMVMGALRYGLICEPKKWKYDLMAGLRQKLEYYRNTGNTEALVDAANYLMLEFMHPSHPEAHFQGEDDHNHCPRFD